MPIGAAIGAVGAIGGSLISSSAASRAAKQQAAAQAAAQKTQQANLADVKGELQPYMDIGRQVMPTLSSFIQGGVNTPQMLESLTQYPGYQFALKQGQNSLNADMAKAGSRISGNQIAGGIAYNQGAATTLFDKYFGHLTELAGIGERGVGAYANTATGTANNISNSQIAAGNARAAGTSAQGNIWSSLVGNTLPGLVGGVAADNPSSWLNKPIGSLWGSSPSDAPSSGLQQVAPRGVVNGWG